MPLSHGLTGLAAIKAVAKSVKIDGCSPQGGRQALRPVWQPQGAPHLARLPAPASFFYSCFDSSKARQTVRQGRFCPSGRGLIQERSQRGSCRACQMHPEASRRVRLFRGSQVIRSLSCIGACARFGCRKAPHPGRMAVWQPFSALVLIAAKPVKPCDRGVFGAFYWLLFLQ